MSIEQEIQYLTTATSELTTVSQKLVEEVSGKMECIDNRLKQSEAMLASKTENSAKRVSELIRSSNKNLKLAAISLHIPDEIYVSEQVELKITNFDSKTHYQITSQFGNAKCVNGVILYTAPKFPVDDSLLIDVNGEKRLILLHIQRKLDDSETNTDTESSLDESKHFGIGTPGEMGFGVGPSDVLPAWLDPLDGCFDSQSEFYGNYCNNLSGIYVHIPAFYYRSGHPDSPQYEQYKQHALDIKDFREFDNEEEANSCGYVLHRAFIDGGNIKKGFFIHKYLCSENPAFRTVHSQKGQIPLSINEQDVIDRLTDTNKDGAGVSTYISLARNIGNGHNVVSIFMYSALSMLSLAQAQAAKNKHACAWLDSEGTKNFPKGCHYHHSGHFSDIHDGELTWLNEVRGSDKFSRTGTCSDFPKSTHNGQSCGVADLSGMRHEVSIGCGVINTEYQKKCFLIAPKSETLTSMCNVNEHVAYQRNYERMSVEDDGMRRLGGEHPVIKGDADGEMYLRDSIFYPCDAATSSNGMNIYGCDALFVNNTDDVGGCAYLGAVASRFGDGFGSGIYSRCFGVSSFYITLTANTTGFRCATYG